MQCYALNKVPAVTEVLSNSLLLDLVFQYLDLDDLKNCSLVNVMWEGTASSKITRNSCLRLQIVHGMCDYEEHHEADSECDLRPDLRRFEQVLFTQQNTCVENMSIWIDDEHFNSDIVRRLFELHANRIRYLNYVLPTKSAKQLRVFTKLLPRFTQLRQLSLTLAFPKKMKKLPLFVPSTLKPLKGLTELNLTIGLFTIDNDDENFWSLESTYEKVLQNVKALVTIAPNVSSLSLKRGNNTTGFDKFEQAILYEKSLQDTWKLRKIEIAAFINVQKFAQLRFDPPLTSLSLIFLGSHQPNPENAVKHLEQILVKHAPNLKFLKINNWWDDESEVVDLRFPVMPRLKTLKLEEFAHFNQTAQKSQYHIKFLDESGSEGLNFSTHFSSLQNLELKFKVHDFEEVCRNIQIFVPPNQAKPVICKTLQNFKLILSGRKHNLLIFDMDFPNTFPNVHNEEFNVMRQKRHLL